MISGNENGAGEMNCSLTLIKSEELYRAVETWTVVTIIARL